MKQELICIELRNFIAVYFEPSKKLIEYDATILVCLLLGIFQKMMQ